MKKLVFFLTSALLLSFTTNMDSLSKQEKKFATKFLKTSQKDLLKTVKGLSAEQMAFKPSPESWSVAECLKHIAITEQSLWKMTEGTINMAANPEKRGEISVTDEGVIKMIEDRTNKVKTNEASEPQNTPYKSADEAIQSFKENRGKLIEYVKETDKDLRNHVTKFPFGYIDTYQMLLFIGAHTNRHRHQIEEVMANPGFPKM